jgi:hypothetical protein
MCPSSTRQLRAAREGLLGGHVLGAMAVDDGQDAVRPGATELLVSLEGQLHRLAALDGDGTAQGARVGRIVRVGRAGANRLRELDHPSAGDLEIAHLVGVDVPREVELERVDLLRSAPLAAILGRRRRDHRVVGQRVPVIGVARVGQPHEGPHVGRVDRVGRHRDERADDEEHRDDPQSKIAQVTHGWLALQVGNICRPQNWRSEQAFQLTRTTQMWSNTISLA